MTAKIKGDFKACVQGALPGGLTRTAYFDGMVLTAADMLREQSYWRTKRRLTNRALGALGAGVVWGLGVTWDARRRCFGLAPGYGLSCCGDDLVVECPEQVPESALIDLCSEDFRRLLAAGADKRGRCERDPGPERPIEACLLLEYVECLEEPRAVFADPCAEDVDSCRYGAIRETTRLRLVPPPAPCPPAALAEFCRKVDEIRAELEQKQPEAIVTPLAALDTRRVLISVAALDADGNTLATRSGPMDMEDGATVAVTLNLPTAPATAQVRFGMEPPAGHLLAAVEVDGTPVPTADTLLGVFRTAAVSAPGQTVRIAAQVLPLFGAGPVTRVAFSLTLTPSGGNAPTGFTVQTGAMEVEVGAPRADCSARLIESLADAGECNLRGLMLALVCGWFKGMLLQSGCPQPSAGEDDDPVAQARLLSAWIVCRIAWRVLFGIDVAKVQGTNVERGLRELFAVWCEGLRYKGPRCDQHAHGIILGCLQVSPKGRVLCFDEWRHRRHVLLGPLLTHWGAQFGLPPLDLAASRLARWICCLAANPMPKLPDGIALSELSTMALAGGAIAAGRPLVAGERLGGAQVRSVREVEGLDFVGRMLGMLLTPETHSLAGAIGMSATGVRGGSAYLLEPDSDAIVAQRAPRAKAEALLAEVDLPVQSLSRMTREPLRDVVLAYAQGVPLAQVKPPADAPMFENLVQALDAEGIVSIADLVELGPEPALVRARTNAAPDSPLADARAAEKSMALVYDAAVKTLASAGQAIVDAAGSRNELEPFTRADLSGAGTLASLRRATNAHLRGNGLSAAELREIVGKVASG
jgi:hypothetical protein